ncbi:Ubiquitin-conjugating enzyme E2 T [Linnemannia gamsii]|uniref:Ubiquitin-conjugating enzyme E2 T n=1 Tax=Linnemannia gamsii TaxID=64522 RepID=A0ABQ7K127_9FUNG|nr:Ubiquitin-conjugating enzyme E2 T [Linnemannia gamsii]
MTVVDKRILIRMRKELKDLEQTPPGVVCYPVNDNIVHLQAEIAGPEDSPYHGGSFKIDIHIPERYPFEPPRCQFLTRVYHPNIDEQGLICLDILKTQPKGTWLPSINITTMLISLQLLLAQPNPDDPLLVDVATEFKENRELFKYKAKEFTKNYAKGVQDAKDTASGSDGETRMVALKELESVIDELDSPSTESLSRSSSSSALHVPPTPVNTTAFPLKTGSSAPVSAPPERISLNRPTHKKLTLSRRPTASAAASAASAASAPFVAPRRKSSVDQGSVVGSPNDSLATREWTPDKVQQEESTPSLRVVKGESIPEPVYISQNKPSSQEASYPSLQDTIPTTNSPASQNTTPDTDVATAGAYDTEVIKAGKKRGAESIKSEELATDTKVKKKIKSEKKLRIQNKSLSRFPSPALESPTSTTGSNSSEPTPSDSAITLPGGAKVNRSTAPQSPTRSAAKTPPPGSQGLSRVKSPSSLASPLTTTALTTTALTKSAPKDSSVIEDMSPPQEVTTQEPELESPPSPGSSHTSEQLRPVSPYSINKGKSRAVDDFMMDVDPRETDRNELKGRTAHKRQDRMFSLRDGLSTTTITATTVGIEALTVAKKRNLLKKNRK